MMVMLVPLNGSRWCIKRYKVVCFYPVHFAMEISALVVDLPVDVGHVAVVVVMVVVVMLNDDGDGDIGSG